MPEPKLLTFDIETAPSIGAYFDRWKEGNIVWTEQPGYMLSYAARWLGQKKTTVRGLPDFKTYKQDHTSDRELVQGLRDLLDAADCIIGHNSDRFDIPWVKARCLVHRIPPWSPIKQIDTLKAAKKMRFESNKLDSLARTLDLGAKLHHIGAELWRRCMDKEYIHEAWRDMKRYNAVDCELGEALYIEMRPWMDTGHPSLSLWTRADACPRCQSKNIMKSGFAYTTAGKKQRMTCEGCGHRFSTGKIIKEVA